MKPLPIRALPRAFVLGIESELPESIELPNDEFKKFHDVLRLRSGAEIAILPGDGRLIRCRMEGRSAVPLEVVAPQTESPVRLTLALAYPKPDKLDESLRMATEMGAAAFVLFPSRRSVVKWDEEKLNSKQRRWEAIIREAAEVSFRTHLPSLGFVKDLTSVLAQFPHAQILSEVEGIPRGYAASESPCLVVGPEGGWDPREVAEIGDRAITLGPRVLRVDTAVAAACALALLGSN